MVLKNISQFKRFYLILKNWNRLQDSHRFITLTNELAMAAATKTLFVDKAGYDAICPKTGEKWEFKESNYYTNGTVAKFVKCGDNKDLADKFLLWDRISETAGKFTSEEIKKYRTKDGQVNVTLVNNVNGRSLSKEGLEKQNKFLIF